MKPSVQTIPFIQLALAFIPVIIVIGVIWKWGFNYMTHIYAVLRMLVQLLLIGYLLAFIFKSTTPYIVVIVLTVMLSVSSWISLRTSKIPRKNLYLKSVAAIFIGGGAILILITQFVLQLHPWYMPNYVIPLAGMIFANAMNAVSLAIERLEAETDRDVPYDKARIIALRASLIPITNSLFAVGLVSLPGMMTGQILSGISPFIAARYQIMVMCMIFGSAGISSACFLIFARSDFIR
jgi:putative ABC transport system permease protein